MAESCDEYGSAADYYDYVPLTRTGPTQPSSSTGADRAAARCWSWAAARGACCCPLARAGIEITGLDLSQGMLGVLRRRLAAEAPEYKHGFG